MFPPETSVRKWSAEDLLRDAATSKLALPDFQRGFEWRDVQVRAFLSSVLAGLPSGLLIVAPVTSLDPTQEGLDFRPLEGVDPTPAAGSPHALLLDGQQRLTALLHATRGLGPLDYFVDVDALLAEESILTEGVVFSRRRRRSFDYRAYQGVPLTALWDNTSLFEWINLERSVPYPRFPSLDNVVKALEQSVCLVSNYDFSVLQLSDDFTPPMTAQVFERLNKYGQELRTFDLVVARFRAAGWSLRSAWNDILFSYPRIERVLGDDGSLALAVAALAFSGDSRRSSILDLRAGVVSEHWHEIEAGLTRTADFLDSRGVKSAEYLPYKSLAVCIAAALVRNPHLSDDRLNEYFWSAAFSARYEVASNTRLKEDLDRLLSAGNTFSDYRERLVSSEQLSLASRRSDSSLFAASICAMLYGGARDLRSGELLLDCESIELTPFAADSSREETSEFVPTRLRAMGQVLQDGAWQKTSRPISLRELALQQELPLGDAPSIDIRLRSQRLPDTTSILEGGLQPAAVARERAGEVLADVRGFISMG
jgi:hypothetical protein